MIKQIVNCLKIQKNIDTFHFVVFVVKCGQFKTEGENNAIKKY